MIHIQQRLISRVIARFSLTFNAACLITFLFV
jgi:hypothetical protein